MQDRVVLGQRRCRQRVLVGRVKRLQVYRLELLQPQMTQGGLQLLRDDPLIRTVRVDTRLGTEASMWHPTKLQWDVFRIAVTVGTVGALASDSGVAVAIAVPLFVVFVMFPLSFGGGEPPADDGG